MKINKLNDQTFYDFASDVIGVDILLYKEVMQMKRTEKGVKLKVYLGGENEDQRKFYFTDTKCIFVNNALDVSEHNLSYDWIQYILDCADELSEEDKQEIVDEYNTNLEQDITNYATQKREQLINR